MEIEQNITFASYIGRLLQEGIFDVSESSLTEKDLPSNEIKPLYDGISKTLAKEGKKLNLRSGDFYSGNIGKLQGDPNQNYPF